MKYQTGKTTLLFIAAAITAIAIGIYVQSNSTKHQQPPELLKGVLLPKTKPLGEVAFTDHNGKPFTLNQLKGKWSILFFGFTNCPDVCPSTMQTLKLVKQKVAQAKQWHNFQVVMVSVDPERDTTERLNSYVPFFDPEFIGVNASVEHTSAFAKNLGILFFKGKPLESGGYDVDHGAALILVNPKGQFAGLFSGPHKVDEISQDLIAIANYQAADSSANTEPNQSDKAQSPAPSVSGNATPQALSITDAWIRPAPPSSQSMAAYFKLSNTSQIDIVITDVDSPAFEVAMIHETVIEEEIASMRHLESLTIPAGKNVVLTPMGTHMMLMGPKAALNEGDSAEIGLTDQNGKRYSAIIEVKQGKS